MGCYPLGKIVHKALGKCNGRKRWREERLDYASAMAHPPTQTCYMRPVARTVTFSSANSVYTIPPDQPPQVQAQHEPEAHPPAQPDPPRPTPPPPERPETRKSKEPGRVRFAPGPPKQPPQSHAPEPSTAHPAHGYHYAPSPLPRWEATPRRHEYFSGEYRCYPTPVREGIYSIATDANRLTNIFSEENPNACAIV